MFHVKNHKQAYIFDPWGPQETKVVGQVMVGIVPAKNTSYSPCGGSA